MFGCSTDIELVTFTGELRKEQDEKLLLSETKLDEEAERSFIFIEKDLDCLRTRKSENVSIPSQNIEISDKKLGWKPLESPRPKNWSTNSVPDEWEICVKTAEADDDTKAGWIQHSAMEKSYSRFTSYVDLETKEGVTELELEMKPSLLEGEMMITQADKVCLYCSQPGG